MPDYTFQDCRTEPRGEFLPHLQAILEENGLDAQFSHLMEMRIGYVRTMDDSYDVFQMDSVMESLRNLPQSEDRDVLLLYDLGYAGYPYLICLSDYNRLLEAIGKSPLTLAENEAAVYRDSDLTNATRTALLNGILQGHPNVVNTEKLLNAVSQQEREQLHLLVSVLEEKQKRIREAEESLREYEEYVEGWVHESKTPLSLLAMILDNRADELSPSLQARLNYVRSRLQEDITQMLYYARLGSSTKDYRFEMVEPGDAAKEVLEDYAPLLQEKRFRIDNRLQGETVYTDRRGLQFMLGQIISNSIKYSGDEPTLTLSLQRAADADILTIADNGVGVKKHDLPYIFQKGFTGDSTDSRRKATGMGLYLTKKMAYDLNVKLEAESRWGEGMTISIVFPKVGLD